MRLKHTIFHTPLPVRIKLEADHPFEAAGDGAGTWLVHDDKSRKFGMVSDGHSFEDSPDCERIGGGINAKGPAAVAIGRQANMLLWGFYGAPDRMTEPAKRAFLNAIVYMCRFEGHVPLVKKRGRGRTWLRQYIDTLADMKPDQLKKDGKGTYVAYLKQRFPAELTRDGVDPAKLRAWYKANEEFIGPGADRRSYVVDADLAARRLSNRKPEFLDWLLATLKKEPNDRVALRLARRYLGENGKDAATAKAWITSNRPFLFFTDTGGYVWLVDLNARRAAEARR